MHSRAQPIAGAFGSSATAAEADAVASDVPATIAVRPGWVARRLAVAVATLVALNLAAGFSGYGDQIFVLDTEQSVPAYFSTLILVAAAGLLALIAALKRRAGDRYRLHWSALSLVFAYLSLDELVGIHEMMGPRVERVADVSAVFYYASTAFTALLVVLFAIAYLRFFFHLSPRFRVLFAASAGLYVGGALLMELVGANFDAQYGAANTGYLLITTVEETMEMSGVVLFIYTLLEYLRTRFHGASLRFASPE